MTEILPLEETDNSCNKILSMPPPTKKEVAPKPKKRRQITEEKQWAFEPDSLENQYAVLATKNAHSKEYQFIRQQVHRKIYGYKYQDLEKGLYSKDEFVKEVDVLELLSLNTKCYYCKESVLLLYEYVRESKQWTLERIDNKRGHNTDNVVIACLGCNLRRRTMYHERFVFTKQMNIVKRG